MNNLVPFFLAVYFGQSGHTYFSMKYLEHFNPFRTGTLDWYNLP